MVRKEKLGNVQLMDSSAFARADMIAKVNRAFVVSQFFCESHRNELDWSNHHLCSHHKNIGRIQQNSRGDKRCALPFCPIAKQVYNLSKQPEQLEAREKEMRDSPAL